jgi:hypothetical protein
MRNEIRSATSASAPARLASLLGLFYLSSCTAAPIKAETPLVETTPELVTGIHKIFVLTPSSVKPIGEKEIATTLRASDVSGLDVGNTEQEKEYVVAASRAAEALIARGFQPVSDSILVQATEQRQPDGGSPSPEQLALMLGRAARADGALLIRAVTTTKTPYPWGLRDYRHVTNVYSARVDAVLLRISNGELIWRGSVTTHSFDGEPGQQWKNNVCLQSSPPPPAFCYLTCVAWLNLEDRNTCREVPAWAGGTPCDCSPLEEWNIKVELIQRAAKLLIAKLGRD